MQLCKLSAQGDGKFQGVLSASSVDLRKKGTSLVRTLSMVPAR